MRHRAILASLLALSMATVVTARAQQADDATDRAARELLTALAEAPTAAEIRAARDRKRAVTAAPDPETVLDISDETFFAALDLRFTGTDAARAAFDAGRADDAWAALDDFTRERWRARADVRQVNNYIARLDEAERARVDPLAEDLGRGVIVARGVRVELDQGGWTQDIGTNSFAGLHYWEWGQSLWKAYARSDRDRYAATFDQLFRSWFAERDAASDVGDYDAIWYELGLAHRPMQVARLFYAMRRSDALTGETRRLIWKTLLGSANQLQRAAECGYTSGNFQMYACNALYQLGLCLPMFSHAARWRETAKRRLLEHAFWDFSKDGGHSERAHGYTQGTLLHLQKLILHSRDDPAPGAASAVLRERVREIELWFLKYATPTAELAGVNDSGFVDGTGLFLNLTWYSKDGRFLWPIRDHDRLPDDVDPVRPEFESVHLVDDGWTILRDGWERTSRYMVVNWGRWGSSHTHDAVLDLNAYAYGRPMVVEAGHFGGYDNPLDPWLRSPEAHNQVILRGEELARRAEHGNVVRWRSGEQVDFFEAFHDGYRASTGRRLRRQVLFVKGDYWLVVDTLERRDREHREVPTGALLWFGTAAWEKHGSSFVSRKGNEPGVQIFVWPEITPALSAGYEDEPAERYGSRYCAAFDQPAVPGARYMTVISPFDTDPVAGRLEVHETPKGLALSIERGSVRDRVFLRTMDGDDLAGDGLRTDGAFAWAREAEGRAAVVDGSRVLVGDRPLVESAEPRELLETVASGERRYLSAPNEETRASDRLPNVVLVYADDMGWGDLGAQNEGSKIPTPHLDRLAREGARFTDAHSSSGICTPSRYALLTGRYHWRKFHGIVQSFGSSVFAPERVTMPEMFQAAGYRTACVGKWHLGWDWDAIKKEGAKQRVENGKKRGFPADAFDWSKPIPDGPLAHGFDHYFGDDVPNFPPYAWIEDDRIVAAPTVPYQPDPKPTEGNPEGRPGPMVEGWKQDAVMPRLTEKAVEWIAAQAESEAPFFLYFPWTSPHAPIVPAKDWIGSTKAGGYGDFLHQSDWSLGQVLAALDEHELSGETIVVFTADNGPEHYAYERVRRFGHRSAGPLRGLKRDVFEGGHRVPFLVRWPGVIEGGTVVDALTSQVDLMATFASIVGYDLPDDAAEDSHDLLPLWKGDVDRVRDTHVHNTFAKRFALRAGNWLLIDDQDGAHTRVPKWFAESEGLTVEAGAPLLFDLSEDLGQRTNVSGEHEDRVASMRARLAAIRERGHSAPRLRD